MKKTMLTILCLVAMLAMGKGLIAQEITITLYPGWTWISYPNAEVMDITTALGDFAPLHGDMIKSQNSTSSYINGQWRGGVTHFLPGRGYMYYSTRTETTSFVFAHPSPAEHEYVDLGLPSGTLWATCNVGATTPEEYGDYFAWGETQPKEYYDWSTYQYCNGNENTLTKYCDDPEYGYNGFTDNLTTLLPEDDAATANWGEQWRMPTKTEWDELLNNTTCTWTIQNGVNGRLFTALNGNSLFLPAAGLRNGDGLYSETYMGYYWSSSLRIVYSEGAWCFFFGSGVYEMDGHTRNSGLTIRPVRSSSQTNAPTGAINGKFTINEEGDQVYFAQGNLQYIGSATEPYWKFAENQWDCLGITTGQNSSDQNVDRDLFGWGTSGWDCGNTCHFPWNTNTSTGSAYGPSGAYNLTGTYANADWGVYNPISNGGDQSNQWRTLTTDEWGYVFDTRTTESGIRYAKANVNDMNGVILLPDDWNASYFSLNDTNTNETSYSSNTITASEWGTMEQHGAVFLPATGYRFGSSVHNVGSHGYYWSTSYVNGNYAYGVYFLDSNLVSQDCSNRAYGRGVRLVQDVE